MKRMLCVVPVKPCESSTPVWSPSKKNGSAPGITPVCNILVNLLSCQYFLPIHCLWRYRYFEYRPYGIACHGADCTDQRQLKPTLARMSHRHPRLICPKEEQYKR